MTSEIKSAYYIQPGGRAFFFATLFIFIWCAHIVPAQAACPAGYDDLKGTCIPNTTGLSDQKADVILKGVMNWLLAVLGFIAVMGFVISGIQYLTAAGDEKTIETAKTNMKYSIIGIIVALSGFVVIQAIDSLLRVGTQF